MECWLPLICTLVHFMCPFTCYCCILLTLVQLFVYLCLFLFSILPYRDSRTKDLLKVVNVDGQVDTRFDVLSAQDPYGHETKQNLFSSPKKEKARSPVNFFQRSRNALMGAADAVRRVAAKAGFGDDTQRIEALVMSMDGMIWTGSANGSVAQWDGSGNRLQEFQHHSSSVQSIFNFGTRLWVGYMDGNIQLLDLDGNLLGGTTL